MKLLIEMTLAIVLTMAALMTASAADYAINVGVWTEHLMNDDRELNEDNKFLQMSVYAERDEYDENRYFTTGGTFINSHFERSFFVGAGKEFTLITDQAAIGTYIAVIKGYEGHINTMYEGLLILPVVYFDFEMVRLTTMGPVVNASLKYEF